MDQRNEFKFLWSYNALNYIVIIIIVLVDKVLHVLICSNEGLIAKLLLQIHSQSFYSIAH